MSSVIKSSNVNIVLNTKTIKFDEHKAEEENSLIQEAKAKYDDLISEAEEKAKEIMGNAEAEAITIKESIFNAAKEEVENIKVEGAKKGYEEGHEAGMKEGYEEGYQSGINNGEEVADKLIAEANDIKRNYLDEREKILSEIEGDVINLTIDICEKILNQKLIEDEELVINMVIKGIKSLNTRGNVTVLVSEHDIEIIEKAREKILSNATLIENIDIKKDINLIKGDCIIESSKGNVDVSLDLQIEEMKSKIKDLLDSE